MNTIRTASPQNAKRIVVIAAITLLALAAGGCMDTDETYSPRYGFTSFAGTKWKAKVKLAVMSVHDRSHLVLVGPDGYDPKDPKYNPGSLDRVLATVPPGTVVQIQRLMQDKGAWGGVYVIATVDAGPYTGKSLYAGLQLLAYNDFLSNGNSPKGTATWDVNPEYLEKP